MTNKFEETKHPRAKDGKFGSGGNSANTTKKGKSTLRLSPTEKAHLVSYSGDDFLRINNSLRNGGEPDASVKAIDSAMEKSTLPEGAKLFRGMEKAAFRKLLGGNQIDRGMILEDKGFASTATRQTMDTHRLGGVAMHITTKTGQHGIDMGKLSSNPHESEVLLPRNSKFKVTGIIPPKNNYDPIIVNVEVV